MKAIHLAAMTILCVTGTFWTPCASAQGFGEEDRHREIEQLEREIQRLEGDFKRAENDRQREELKKTIGDRRMRLEELRGREKRGPQGEVQQKMARLERHIHELEMKLEREDLGPEDRKELRAQLDRARGEMDELRQQAKMMQDSFRRGPGMMGPPPDPETQKMQSEAAELERECMNLAAALRRVPKDGKEERDQLTSKLKESVTKLFDAREKLRAREVEMIKKRLAELTDLLEKRKVNRDAIIEKRIKQLTGEADPLDW